MDKIEEDIVDYESPFIQKKDLNNIEKTIGSIKDILIKQAEEKIKDYLKKNNITEYYNEPFRESYKYA
jgi:hypothetical protein